MSLGRQAMVRGIDVASYIVLLVAVFAFPWWVDGGLSSAVIGAKQYLLFWLTGAIVVAQGLKIMVGKKIKYRISVLDLPWALLCIGGFLSALFSASREDSFIGNTDFFVFSFVFILLLAAWYGLCINLITTPRRWQVVYDTLVGSGTMTLILFVVRSLFKFDLLSVLSGRSIVNIIDDSNGVFGVWVVVLLVLTLGQLLHKSVPARKKIFYFAGAALSLIALVLLSFKMVWVMVALALGLLLLVGAGFIQEVDLTWLSVIFALFIFTGIFIVFDTPRALQTMLPIEAALNSSESWSVTWKTWSDNAKNLLIGSGLGTFNIDFSQFRNVVLNMDPVAATLRFNQPFNTIFAIMVEGGLLVFMALCLLVSLSGFYFVMTAVKLRAHFRLSAVIEVFELEKKHVRWQLLLVGGAWLVLTVGMIWFSFGPVGWWGWVLLLGLLITALSFENHRLIRTEEWVVEDTAEQQVLFSFVIVAFLSALTFGEIWSLRYYAADKLYTAALRAADFSQVENKLTRAIYLHGSAERYHMTLAQAYVLQAVREGQNKEAAPERIGSLLGLAVNRAKYAAELAPRSVEVWENLANMYENAALLVPETRQLAIAAINEGRKLEPSNPFLVWRLGNNYALLGQWNEAIANYQEALNLKKDYAAAYVSLAAVYEKQKLLDKAVGVYEGVAYDISNNPELLFQYGRILYNRNRGEDRKRAVSLWEAVVRLDPRNSNALYSLGYWYESLGKKEQARSYYQKVAELNPGNAEISAKLKSVQ